MKLFNARSALTAALLLSLSAACNKASFKGKSGLSGGPETAPQTTIPNTPEENPGGNKDPGKLPDTDKPGSPTPDKPSENPGGTPNNPGGTPETPKPGPETPTTPQDPDCKDKGTCQPCEQGKTNCPTIPEECTLYGLNCPGPGPDDPSQHDTPNQSDDPGQH